MKEYSIAIISYIIFGILFFRIFLTPYIKVKHLSNFDYFLLAVIFMLWPLLLLVKISVIFFTFLGKFLSKIIIKSS